MFQLNASVIISREVKPYAGSQDQSSLTASDIFPAASQHYTEIVALAALAIEVTDNGYTNIHENAAT